MDYTPKQVRRIIERYQELRSAAEVAATKFDRIPSRGANPRSMEDIICMIVDLDQATAVLPPRQQAVVNLVKAGYPAEIIGHRLGIKPGTVNIFLTRAIFRIATYLNSG